MFSGNVPDGDEPVEKRDNKKEKDKGYVAFYSDDEEGGTQGDDEAIVAHSSTTISRMKSKKSKKEKQVKPPKRKGKMSKKQEKGKNEKEKVKEKEKKKQKKVESPEQPALPVFGVSLEEAAKRSMLPDGIYLPRVIRECIMQIEEKGLTQEGIYRLSGVKSKIETLKELYNQGKKVDLDEYEPNILAGLVKLFIRELSDCILPEEIAAKFEEAAALPNRQEKINRFKKLMPDLPVCNRTLLSWLMVHMLHVLQKTSENKMSIQSIGIVLHPTTGIAQPVLNILLNNITTFFGETKLTKYEVPSKPEEEDDDVATPETPEEIAAELSRQEVILAQLHEDLKKGTPEETEGKDEELWEVQRKVTQLNRKLRVAKRNRKVEVVEVVEVVEEQKKQEEEDKPPSKEDEEAELLKRLELEEMELRFKEEELLEVREQLEKRLQNEKSEIHRLEEEIAVVTEARANNSGVHSDQNSSSDSDHSESDEDESELEEIMNDLVQQNEELEAKNMELVKQLHEEQESCVELKVQIRLVTTANKQEL